MILLRNGKTQGGWREQTAAWERSYAGGIERESLYRALSANGNPRLSTLFAVAKAIGLKLTVEAA